MAGVLRICRFCQSGGAGTAIVFRPRG